MLRVIGRTLLKFFLVMLVLLLVAIGYGYHVQFSDGLFVVAKHISRGDLEGIAYWLNYDQPAYYFIDPRVDATGLLFVVILAWESVQYARRRRGLRKAREADPNAVSTAPSKRMRWSRPSVITVAACTAILVGSFAWLTFGRANYHLPVPKQVIPVPNAYDALVRAHVSVKDEDVVYDIYDQARPGDRYLVSSDGDRKFVLARMTGAIRDNAPVIAQIHRALQMRYWAPESITDAELHKSMDARDLGYILVTRGDVDVAQGDLGNAAGSYLDSIALESQMQENSTEIQAFEATLVADTARKKLWEIRNKLPGSAAKITTDRLRAILELQVSLSDMLQQAQWDIERSLESDFAKPDWPIALSRGNDRFIDATDWRAIAQSWFIGRTRMMQDCDHGMDALRASAELPYQEFAKTATPKDSVLTPVFSDEKKIAFSIVGGRLNDEFLLTALALHVYFLDHGAYPSSLSDLVPTILPAVPQDPFALNAPLRYRRDGSSYLLYSIGPDGVDNNGTPFTPKDWVVYPFSKGDIPAGVRWIYSYQLLKW